MASDKTLAFLMIKPCAVEDGHVGEIITDLERAGFELLGIASRRLTAEEAGRLYDIHRGKPFFEPLVEFITSGISIGLMLGGPGIPVLRQLIGKTDPAEAAEGTIRAKFGRTLRENAVHASDSVERLDYEAGFYFGDCPRALTSVAPGGDGNTED